MVSTRLLVLQFMLLTCLALILVPAGAHLFEFSAKMGLNAGDYMVTQRIYAGWAWFGAPIYLSIILLVIHATIVRSDRAAFALSLVALVAIVLTQIIFWLYTFPMNSLTQNWTVAPPDLDAARRQWELSHAVNAGLTFLAFVSVTLSVLIFGRKRA